LAGYTLELLARGWAHSVAPVGLVEEWFELAAALRDPPEPPELTATWIELLPAAGDPLSALDAWTKLAEVLAEHAPARLAAFGFPGRYRTVIRAFVSSAPFTRPERAELALAIARRLHRLVPGDVPKEIGHLLAHAARPKPEL